MSPAQVQTELERLRLEVGLDHQRALLVATGNAEFTRATHVAYSAKLTALTQAIEWARERVRPEAYEPRGDT